MAKRASLAKARPTPNPESESNAVAVRDFVRLEKNLSTIGYFTPTKGRGKSEVREKTVRIKRQVGDKTVVASATILPVARYGLPTTADQDKYLAFQKIVNDLRQRDGAVSNPVSFTSAELLQILGITKGGNNYEDIYAWLGRMSATTIQSEGVVYLAKRKVYARDIFHVFDRVVVTGGTLPDGRQADRNYVWLSSWQLENINGNYLLPVDFETYRRLSNPIAKALVPLLQQWLYASRSDGRFEKRYEDLCDLLDLRRQAYQSYIERQLGPSLDELMKFGYLANWSIGNTNDGRDFKIVACHGPKFFADLRARVGAGTGAGEVDQSPAVLEALTSRGVAEAQARRLLRSLPAGQPVMDQIEYIDSVVRKGRIANPPGLYVTMLRNNEPVPEDFESSRRRAERERSREHYLAVQSARWEMQQRYDRHVAEELARHIAELGDGEFDGRVAAEARAVRKAYPLMTAEQVQALAAERVRRELRETLPLATFEEFSRNPQESLF
jgi:hypothetical protein